jgi:FkbM family methyltransferase
MRESSLLAAAVQRLRSEKRPFRFLASRLLWKTGMCRLFTIERRGYRIRFEPTAMSASLWVDRDYSAADEGLFRALLKPGDVVVDAGANIGALTLCAATAVGPAGVVFSVEAHPRTFRYLTRNLQLNRCANVEAFNLALGERRDKVRFTTQRSDDQNAVATDGQGIEIDLCPLDEVIRGEEPIAL